LSDRRRRRAWADEIYPFVPSLWRRISHSRIIVQCVHPTVQSTIFLGDPVKLFHERMQRSYEAKQPVLRVGKHVMLKVAL
jgi:hypothetical protein